MGEPERIGIYGGTFDPIHIGHLAIAEEARVALGLSRVMVVPAARQPLKGAEGAPAEHRLAMARLACADNPAFVVDDLELRRPPPSYTIDTLRALAARLGPTAELYFVLGADAARDLPRWRSADAILALARIAVVGRPGTTLHLPSLAAALPAAVGRVTLLPGPHLDISSTELRRRIAENRPVRYLVPEPVRAYIAAHGLYRHASAS
ncbi:MAG: nicotinate-nucleotide adenylyltransferase [Chloroflexi bacterium OHK40]